MARNIPSTNPEKFAVDVAFDYWGPYRLQSSDPNQPIITLEFGLPHHDSHLSIVFLAESMGLLEIHGYQSRHAVQPAPLRLPIDNDISGAEKQQLKDRALVYVKMLKHAFAQSLGVPDTQLVASAYRRYDTTDIYPAHLARRVRHAARTILAKRRKDAQIAAALPTMLGAKAASASPPTSF